MNRTFLTACVAAAAAAIVILFPAAQIASAVAIRGTGDSALIGRDLTDPENDGAADANTNYNATFAASEEPNFGGSEGAFNVFDNLTGGGNNKFCCGDLNNFPTNPITIDATFANPIVLRTFTLTSSNDTPTRDPRVFQIQGSNDGTNFTTIYSRTDSTSSPWTAFNQVLQYDVGVDFVEPAPYSTIRFLTTATGATSGARFALGEIEYFDVVKPVPEPTAAAGLAVLVAGAALRRRRRA